MIIDEIKKVLKEQYNVYFIGIITYNEEKYVIGEMIKNYKTVYYKLLKDNFIEVNDERVLKYLKEIADNKSSNIIY